MDLNNFKNTVLSFILHIPATLRETSIWFLISYIIPIVNIGILWAMKRNNFEFNLPILSIIIVTNACFLTALIYQQTNQTEKKRKIINTISIITLIITVVLFAISTIDLEKKDKIFAVDIYQFGSISTLLISIILGLVSKYDEVEAESKDRARKAKETTVTTIGDKQVKL